MTSRSSARHLALGAEGEDRAARHLASEGYRIVARNVRADGVEIDLIARRGRTIVFVEVKTRRSTRFGPPELAVDLRKQTRLVRGAYAWLSTHGRGIENARFDVIACVAETNGPSGPCWRIRHIPGAFDADAGA